jgi:lysophospholipase L1-like esterase
VVAPFGGRLIFSTAMALCASIFSRIFGALFLAGGAFSSEAPIRRFVFEPGPVASGVQMVGANEFFSVERGYGFEPGSSSAYFTTDLPEGNWRVTISLRGVAGGGVATVKAELRRLVLGPLPLAENETLTRTFIVNTRNPQIAARNGGAAGRVKLKAPRETTQEAWAWDDRLTLEVHGAVLRSLEILPARVPTVFLLGDSTVCDQSLEPFASWGQMLPRFFGPTVAIANHGESGETYRDSIARGRLEKVISVMQPGDLLLMQFGHNDQKQLAAGTGGPFTTYQEEMKVHVTAVRRVGGVPVIVSPMERRRFDAKGKVQASLTDYAQAARATAIAERVAFIDLNALSQVLYAALGPEQSANAFAAPAGQVDNTHHNNYGAFLLARCVARGLVEAQLDVARELLPEFRTFDPARPESPEIVAIPPSPRNTHQRPLGN